MKETYSVGPLRLLMLQPTPYCPLDCGYCYLAGRLGKARMSSETAELAIVRAMESGLVTQDFSIVWHMGEPLIVDQEWYQHVDRMVGRYCKGFQVTHVFQSNALLINNQWCDLFKSLNMRLGISIDGPQHIHDGHRKTRAGKGTFKAVMKGVECLRRNGMPFGVLAVVTREFLEDFETALDFFEAEQMTNIGFNVEEIEGIHKHSSLGDRIGGTRKLFRDFMRECYRRHAAGRLNIREVREYERFFQNQAEPLLRTDLNTPFRIVVVGHDGAFSTFSPELHTVNLKPGVPFVLGNVHKNSYLEAFSHPLFAEVMSAIIDGHSACEKTCRFFGLCGGGSPSHKFFQLGTMAGTETAYCSYRVKERATVFRDEMGRELI